jgi:hypothetical protein
MRQVVLCLSPFRMEGGSPLTESPQTQQVSAYPEPGFAKTSLVGALTAIVATLPVSILKTMAALSRLCLPLGASRSDAAITLSTCGVFYNTWNADTTSFLLYLLFVLLGGAFFGVIASRTAMRTGPPGAPSQPAQRRSRIYWRSVAGALLFDLLFVVIFLYPGQ